MDAEPRGRTIDGTPWEEPRPPHLPDRLTSVSPWVRPFILVVAYQVWLLWIDQARVGNPGDRIQYWLSSRYGVTGFLGSLVGLALFIRHPDARATLPQIASGAFLLLLQQVMGLFEPTLVPLLRGLIEPSGELFSFSPLEEAYSIFASIVGVFGIAFIASGLSAARRYEDVGPVRGIAAVVAMMAVVSAGFSMLGSITLEFDTEPMMVAVLISSLLVRLFGTLAFAYLVVVSLSGWLAREEPRFGWRLATVGASLMLLLALVRPFFGVLPLSQEGLFALIGIIAYGAVIGWVLLVVAFALGLPSTESIPAGEAEPSTPDRRAAMTPDSGAG